MSKGDEFVEEFKKEVEELNENETYTSWLTPEEDEKFILNTEKSISFQEGINQGITQGIAQGFNQRNLEIARNLLSQNIDISIIVRATGLTKEEIEKLTE